MKSLLFILCTLSSAFAIDARSVISAGNYQEKNNPTSSRPSGPGSGAVGYIDNGSWLKYTQVDFGSQPVESISIRASSGGSGGTINVRIGSSTGHLLSSVAIPSTGGWHITKTFRSAITHPATPLTGINDLVLEFVGGGSDLFNVESFIFDTSMSWKSDVLAGDFLRESHPNNNTIIQKSGSDLLNATQASWVDYGLFDFGAGMNYLWIDVAASTANPPQDPRRVEFRTDSLTGNLIGTLEIPNTQGSFKPLGLKFSQPVSGTKKLFLRFVGPPGDFFHLRKFRFQHLAPDHKSTIIPARVKRDPLVTAWTPAAPFSLEDPASNIAPPPPAADNTNVRPVGSRVEWISPNTWVKYAGHPIVAGANRISIIASSPISGGGNVEVRIGSPTGTPLASINVQTSWWTNYDVFTAKIPTPPSGPQDVYFRFTGSAGYVLNLERFRFYFDPLISGSPNAERSSGVAPVTLDSDVITGLTNASWVRYDGVNFGPNANLITVKAATPNKGGEVQVRLDSPTGPQVATIDITHTGSFTNFREFPERLLQLVSGVRTVYLTFVDTHHEGGSLFNLKGFIIETKAEPPATPSNQGTLTIYPEAPGLPQSPYYTYSVQKVSDLNAARKENATNWQNPFAWFSECKVSTDPYAGWYYGWMGGWSHTYCNFELGKNTPIVVKISRTGGNPHSAPAGPIFMANAHPAHKVQSCEIINGDVYVTMSQPALVTVDIDGQMDTRHNIDGGRVNGSHAVSIFANPVITDKPAAPSATPPSTGPVLYVAPGESAKDKMSSRDDWTTLYFLPGVHSLFGFVNGEPKSWEPGDKCQLPTEKSIYIPGDAIVYGCFDSKDGVNRNNLRVFGHGTLSGRYVPHVRDGDWWNRNGTNPAWGKDRDGVDGLREEFENSPIQISSMTNCRFEGITVADPAFHAITGGGSDNIRRWLKQISWRSNSDMGGVNGIVEDGFYRLQDDGIYVSSSDFRRNTLWFDINGQAYRGSFITAGSYPENHQTIMEDCDIIYVRSIFGGGVLMGSGDFWDGGGGQGSGTYPDGTKNTAQHVIFRNIRVTDPRPERSLFGFSVPSGNPQVGGIAGIRFENIELRHPQTHGQRSQFSGSDTMQVHHLYFDGVTLEGKKLDTSLINDASLFDPLINTSNFVFRDAPDSPIVIGPPPVGTTIDTTNLAKDLYYDDPQNTYIGNGSLVISGNGSPENTVSLGTNAEVQSTNFAMTGGLITIDSGVTLQNGGWQKGNWSSNKASMLINGTLDLWDGNPVFVDALSGQGKVVFEDQWNWNARVLNVGVNGGSGTFSGEIEAPGSISHIQLVKWGSGTQTLDNLANQKPREIIIHQGSVNLAGDIPVTVDSNISGAGNLIKSGAGLVSLGGILTYSGNTTVLDGTLSVPQPAFTNTSTVTIGLVGASPAVLHLPNAGTSIVSQLIIDGVVQPGNGAVYDSLNSNGAITGIGKLQVGFAIIYNLATHSGTNGSISSNPSGISHLEGTVVTLTATPHVGYKFDFWSGDLTGTTNPLAITMNSNKSVTANFSRIRVLLVVGETAGLSDLAIQDRLLSLGYDVQTITDNLATTASATGKTLVLVSSTVGSSKISTKFQSVAAPVINWESLLQDDFLFTTGANQGTSSPQTTLQIVNSEHPLAAGLTAGVRTVATSADSGGFSWGAPGGSPIVIARLNDGSNQPCIYAYETGAAMISGTAPARRVHLFLQNNTFATLNADGRKLFDAAISWAMGVAAPSGPTAGPEYGAWATNMGVSGGINDDDDHDNLSNFAEYAFGLQPDDASSLNPIVVPVSAIDGTFSYRRRKTISATMDYSIRYSTTLAQGSWSEDTGAVEGAPVIQGETEIVPVRISRDLLKHPELFIQVLAATGAQE